MRRKYSSIPLGRALEFLEGVSWVRFGAGKSIQEWATRPTEVQEAILKSVRAERLLPVA